MQINVLKGELEELLNGKILIKSKKIAEIRDALRILLLSAQNIQLPMTRQDIIKQIERIDRLLPQVELEKATKKRPQLKLPGTGPAYLYEEVRCEACGNERPCGCGEEK